MSLVTEGAQGFVDDSLPWNEQGVVSRVPDGFFDDPLALPSVAEESSVRWEYPDTGGSTETDENGNLRSRTLPDGSREQYDEDGSIVSVIDPYGGQTRIGDASHPYPYLRPLARIALDGPPEDPDDLADRIGEFSPALAQFHPDLIHRIASTITRSRRAGDLAAVLRCVRFLAHQHGYLVWDAASPDPTPESMIDEPESWQHLSRQRDELLEHLHRDVVAGALPRSLRYVPVAYSDSDDLYLDVDVRGVADSMRIDPTGAPSTPAMEGLAHRVRNSALRAGFQVAAVVPETAERGEIREMEALADDA